MPHRTVSLSRDFVAVAGMVEPTRPCYLVVYVGDAQHLDSKPASATLGEQPREWVLISYVPSSCSQFEAKRMADNRAGLKAGLGAEKFAEGGMWCVHVEQISLSNHMRLTEASAAGASVPGVPNGTLGESDALASALSYEEERATSAVKLPPRSPAPRPRRAVIDDAMVRDEVSGASLGMGALTIAATAPIGTGEEPADATEAIWEERLKGVRHAYADSCSRLVGSLEELEETLCALTGEPFRREEPILRARVHMEKNLELLR